MIKHKVATLFTVAASLLALTHTGFAGDDVTKEPKPVTPETPVERRISGDVGISFVSQYISRGLVLNNQGPISQDYADIYVNLYESKSFLNKVQFNLGIWADLDPHSTQAGTANGHANSSSVTLPWWYEFDFNPGFTFTFAKYFTFSPTYYIFTSPASAFHTFQGVNLNFGVDDSPWLGKFALHPSFTFLRECFNKAGDGKGEGNYYEIGVTPATAIGPVSLSLPVTVGLGSNEFYGHNRGFGYVTPGFQVGVPLSFIPASYGSWNFTAFYKFYYFGSDLARFNAQDKNQVVLPGDENESVRQASHHTHLFSAGLTVTF